MSVLTDLWPRVAVRERVEVETTAPTLRPVPTPRAGRMARVPFLAFLGVVLGLGLAGLVLLNTMIQTQAQEVAILNNEAVRLEYKQASLTAQVQQLRSSAHLAQAAHGLGMRPNANPAFIVLPEGTILGTPTKVTGAEFPDQVYRTWDQLQIAQENARAKVAAEAKAAEEARKKAEEAKRAAAAKKKADEAKLKAAETKKKAAEAKKKADEAKKKAASQQSTQPTTSTAAGAP